MTTYADITRKSKVIRTPELNWLFEEWAETLYGSWVAREFNDNLGTGRANLYCPSCSAVYSAQEAFNVDLEYEVLFPTDAETGKLGTPRLIKKGGAIEQTYVFNVDGWAPPAKRLEEEYGIQPLTDKGLAEKLDQKVRVFLLENREDFEKGGWIFNPDGIRIGQHDGHTAPFFASYSRGTERMYVRGELDQSGEVPGTSREHVLNLRCRDPKCREMPLKTFRLGTDQTFDPDPRHLEWTAYDKYMLALPEPPLGADGKVAFDKTHEYVTADYLNALLSEDHAGETMLYLEKINHAQRLEIPSSDLPRGWRISTDAAQAYKRKAQRLHDSGIMTPYAQFLRWREQGAGEIKEIIENVQAKVRGASRIAAAKRIADFPPLTSKPDLGENPPESYLVRYKLDVKILDRSIPIELKHVPDVRLTRNSTTHDRLKRIEWEFLWLRGGQIAEAKAEQPAS